MNNMNDEYCLWDGYGNGNYLTQCGELYKDPGRFNKMLNETYHENNPDIQRIKVCPKCKKLTITYEEARELEFAFRKRNEEKE